MESNLNITPHNFDVEQANFQKLLDEIDKNTVSLMNLEEQGKFLGIISYDKKVKASDFNLQTVKLQEEFAQIKKNISSLFSGVKNVYGALTSLDKEYIAGIVGAIKATEEAHVDIENTVTGLKRTVEILEDFQTRIEALEHLGGVDDLWQTSQELIENLKNIKESLDETIDINEAQKNDIDSLQTFRENLETQIHLLDIDSIWNACENISNEISKVEDTLSEIHTVENLHRERLNQSEAISKDHEERIANVQEFQKNLEEQQHLFDIDNIHKKAEDNGQAISNANQEIEINKQEIIRTNENIAELLIEYQENNKRLNKRLKISYWLIGSSLGVGLLQFILNIMGVL